MTHCPHEEFVFNHYLQQEQCLLCGFVKPKAEKAIVMTSTERWEKEFDKQFPHQDDACMCCGGAVQGHRKAGVYKSFIQSEILKAREEGRQSQIRVDFTALDEKQTRDVREEGRQEGHLVGLEEGYVARGVVEAQIKIGIRLNERARIKEIIEEMKMENGDWESRVGTYNNNYENCYNQALKDLIDKI